MAKRNKAAQRYTGTHWGFDHGRVHDVNDPDLPDDLVQMGELRELEVRGAEEFNLTYPQAPGTRHVAFSPDGDQRLYLITTRADQAEVKRGVGSFADVPTYPLQHLADAVGGRQARYKYPRHLANLPVVVLGHLQAVIYYTRKKGEADEREGCEYRHRMGEEGGVEPLLCVDARGRLWIAGGSYKVLNDGIAH